MTQAALPPWGQSVIFVDWHGVLSRDPFWTSILSGPRHPMRPSLEEKLAEVFARDQPTAQEWMKGELSSTEIILGMRLPLPARYRADYLRRKLHDDFRAMIVNTELINLLNGFRPDSFVVLATDNMDCFAAAFGRVAHRRDEPGRGRRRRRLGGRVSRPTARPSAKPPEERRGSDFAACVSRCDDLLCSSDLGALKSEDPEAFFGPWLRRHDLTFGDAVLIDDRVDNCAAFTGRGGTAIRWKLGADSLGDLESRLQAWIRFSSVARASH